MKGRDNHRVSCRRQFVILSYSLLLAFCSYGQNMRVIDSLEKCLQAGRDDTARVSVYLALSREFLHVNAQKNQEYAARALTLSQQLNYTKGEAESYMLLGVPDNLTLSLKKFQSLNDSSGIARVYHAIGMRHWDNSDYPAAMDYLLRSMNINEALHDAEQLAQNYNGLGLTFYMQKNYDQALHYHNLALEIRKKLNNPRWLAMSLNNMALVYEEQEKDSTALEYYFRCLHLVKGTGRKNNEASVYGNIANIYSLRKEYETSLRYHDTALQICREIEGYGLMIENYIAMGNIYEEMERYNDAIKNYNTAFPLLEKTGNRDSRKKYYLGMSKALSGKKDFEKAYDYLVAYILLKDSIMNAESAMKIAYMQGKYTADKLEKETLLREQKTAMEHQAELKQRSIIIYTASAGLILVMAFAVFIYRSYKQKQKANVEITRQKKMIEEKQKEILDSIRYARRIQQSLLPTEKYIHKTIRRLMKK